MYWSDNSPKTATSTYSLQVSGSQAPARHSSLSVFSPVGPLLEEILPTDLYLRNKYLKYFLILVNDQET